MDDLLQQINNLNQRVQALEAENQKLRAAPSLPFELTSALEGRFKILQMRKLENAPLGAISSPTGGSTIDSQARTAIDTIRNRLTDLGLTA